VVAIVAAIAGLSLIGILFFCYKRRKLCFGWRGSLSSKQMLRSGSSQQDGVEMAPLERNALLTAEQWPREIVNPGAYPIDYQQHWNGAR